MPYYSGAVATERSSLSFKMPGTTSGYSSTTSSSYRTGASDRPYYSSSTGSYTRSAIPRSLSIDTKSTYSSGTSSLQNRTSSLTSSRHSSLSEDSGISSRSSFSSQDRDSRESSVTSTRSRDSATKSRFLDSGVSSSTGILSRRTYGSSSSSPLDSDFLSKYSPANYVPNSDIGRPPLRSVTTPCLDSERASAPKSTIRSRNRSSATEAEPAPTTGTSDYSYGRSSRGAGLAVGGCAISERRVRNKSAEEDTDGSAGASSSARTRDRTHTSAAASASLGLVGIRNLGNTCFMNSVVQCLSNTKPLKQYLLDNGHLNDLNTTNSEMKGSLIKAFATVIQELWDPNATIVSPNGFKSQIGRFAPRFNNYNQQDAQEFLRYLLEGLHEDVNRVRTKPMRLSDSPDNLLSNDQKAAEYWKRYLRFDNSKIVDIFVGQLCSTLRCTVCQHSSLTFDPFWDLSLPLPTRTGTLKLQQCFEHFTKEEVLDGDEKPTCAKCQMRRKCTKSLTIQKFPKILVLHLKRFSPNERYRAKLSVPVTFPLDGLDLSPFAEGRDKNCTYRLYGIANHSGTTYSGHYMAYCKHPVSGDWHQYNDTRVSSISTSQLVSSEAYLLFYEQTNS